MSASNLQDRTNNRMRFTLLPSLKSLVLTKIATLLLDRRDVRVTAWNICVVLEDTIEFLEKKVWKKFGEYVMMKGYRLPIQSTLKRDLIPHIAGTAWELFLWLEFHVNRWKIVSKIPDRFIWTSHGLIDKKGMAQLLVKDSELDIISRYKLACLYCLESDIGALWKQIRIGRSFTKNLEKKNLDEPAIVAFWSHHMAGKLKLMHQEMNEYCNSCTFTPNEYAFRLSVGMGNEVATRFFFAKLNPGERERLPAATAEDLIERASYLKEMMFPGSYSFRGEHFVAVLLFFLEEVVEFDLNDVFIFDFAPVLECFLDWPYQNVFMKAVEYFNKHFYSLTYYTLFRKIAKKLVDEIRDYDYSKLFFALWNSIKPSEMKDVVQRCLDRPLLLDLCDLLDWRYIDIILKAAPSADKESFILSECGEFICKRLIYQENWGSLKDFICDCIASRQHFIDFMGKLLKSEPSGRVEEAITDRYNGSDSDSYNSNDSGGEEEDDTHLMQIFQELLKTKYNKRNAKDGPDESAKRPRC